MSAARMSQIPGVQTIAWALLHSLWQGALVALALAGGLVLLRRADARLRYAAAFVALLLLPVLPLLTALGAEDDVSVAVRVLETSPSADSALDGLRAAAAPVSSWRSAVDTSLPTPLLVGIVAIWLTGVLALSALHLGGLHRLRRLRQATRPVPSPWPETVARLSRRMGINRSVWLVESTTLAVPAVVGWLRPVLLLPASTLTGLPPDQIEALLAHELAHVRRGDYAWNLLQVVIETLLFYHPAAWWVSRTVRAEREHCCDDLAAEVCGDRLVVARALVDLEGLRATVPSPALGADGGSLLGRIRRLLAPAPGVRRSEAWLVGALVLALCVAAAAAAPFVSKPGFRSAAATPEEDATRRTGTWAIERQGGRTDGEEEVQLDLKYRWPEGRSHFSFGLPLSELAGLAPGKEARFALRRDAGTFRFTGAYDGRTGRGTFHFEPDPGYRQEMGTLGWSVPVERQIELALHDVTRAFARGLRDNGYGGAPLDRLVEMRIHGVTLETIQGFAKAGYRGLPAERLIELQIHGVTPESAQGLAATGLKGLSAEKLIELQIHGVTPEYVRGLVAAGLPSDLTADRLIELHIHGVTPEYARGLAEAGQRVLPAEKLVELHIHGVSPEYVKGLADVGYPALPSEDLVQLKIQGVDATFVREAAARGYRRLPPEELVQLKILGYEGYARSR